MRRTIHRFFVVLSALTAPAGCNAIFGIELGVESGSTTTGGTGGTTVTTTGGTGGVTGGTGGTTGGTGGVTGGTGGATGGSCAGTGGPPATGKSYLQRTSYGDNYHEAGRAAAFTPEGHLVVAGTLSSDKVDFGGGALPYSMPMIYPDEVPFVARFDAAGDHVASVAWSVTGTARPHAVAVDPATGDIVLVGEFIGDLQIGNDTLHSFDPDYSDTFVTRLTADLTPIWSKRFGDAYRQEPDEVALDSQGNIVIVGATFNKTDFGGGQIGSNIWSSFAVKLHPDGTFFWNQWYDAFSPFSEELDDNYFGLALAIAPNDDVIVGSTFGAPVFFGGSQAFPKGGQDAYVVRLAAADEALVWKRLFDGGGDANTDGDQWVTSLAVDGCGDVYVAGAFTKQLGKGGEAPTPAKGSDPLLPDMFLAKLDGAGGLTWQRTYGDAGWQEPSVVRADAYGHVVLAGFMKDQPGYTGVDFGPGIGVLSPSAADPGPDYRDDAFVVLLRPDGAGLWGRRLGDGDYQRIFAAAFDQKGQLAVVGEFAGTMVLDESATPISAQNTDVFVGWYDKSN